MDSSFFIAKDHGEILIGSPQTIMDSAMVWGRYQVPQNIFLSTKMFTSKTLKAGNARKERNSL